MNERESFAGHEEKRNVETDDFAAARRALDAYPRLQASADFDRQVLARVKFARSPIELFCDRLDAIFSRPLLKLCASAIGGMSLGLFSFGMFLQLPQNPAQLNPSVSNMAQALQTSSSQGVLLTNRHDLDLYVRQTETLEDGWNSLPTRQGVQQKSPSSFRSSKRGLPSWRKIQPISKIEPIPSGSLLSGWWC